MFIQIHMLQSMPPGNLNRDDAGQPKRCIFGGVTRARISSQCLKRRIREYPYFQESTRTQFLPKLTADAIRQLNPDISEQEINSIKMALSGKFKSEKKKGTTDGEGESESQENQEVTRQEVDDTDKTGQLVFFPQPFAQEIAKLIADFRVNDQTAYRYFLGDKKSRGTDEKPLKEAIQRLCDQIAEASKKLTIDIGLFGRMTTSDLVVDVEAACQVAHAISTHETHVESDYFTAMDDLAVGPGAGFIGSGESETFFNSAVYYKYLNLDLTALHQLLPTMTTDETALVVGHLIQAAALQTPTGKQNSFAAHSIPEFILVETSQVKRPISYANAFLQPVQGGTGHNLMTESAEALRSYIAEVAEAYRHKDMQRTFLALGPASTDLPEAERCSRIDELVSAVTHKVTSRLKAGDMV